MSRRIRMDASIRDGGEERGGVRSVAATGQVALVTGGSRGLGAVLVSSLLRKGYAVATLSRSRSEFIEQTLRRRRRAGAPPGASNFWISLLSEAPAALPTRSGS